MNASTALARAIIARSPAANPPRLRGESLVVFPARARVVQTDVGQRRIFDSRCGRYRISETRYSCKALKSRWYAMKQVAAFASGPPNYCVQPCWDHVGRFRHHTTYAACLAAIEKDANKRG
jgi:hypothetical protein